MAKKKNQQQKKSNTAKPVSNVKGPSRKPVHKERGTLLSVLIILIGVHAVIATYIGFITLKDQYVNTSWVLPLLILSSVICIGAAVALWYWKQWGITLYAVACIIQAAVHLMLTGSLMVVFYDILPVAILAYVINLQSKQRLFE